MGNKTDISTLTTLTQVSKSETFKREKAVSLELVRKHPTGAELDFQTEELVAALNSLLFPGLVFAQVIKPQEG